MEQFIGLLAANLLSPVVLFFALGLAALIVIVGAVVVLQLTNLPFIYVTVR